MNKKNLYLHLLFIAVFIINHLNIEIKIVERGQLLLKIEQNIFLCWLK